MALNLSLVKKIMALSASEINAMTGNGTLFHAAISQTDIPMKELRELKRRGVNFNALTVREDSILIVAIDFKRSNDCVKNLIKLGADPKFANPEGDTLLHLAVTYDNLELATYLVSVVGCDVNTVNKKGDAPLHKVFGVKTCGAQLAKLLLENGANINVKGSSGYTPAKLMVHHQVVPFELMQVLKEYGADFNSTDQDPYGSSLLYGAVHFKHDMDRIRNLVQLGADPKKANYKGQTPLFVAVVKGYVEAAEYLISVGCDVNGADNKGDTLLHYVLDKTSTSVSMAKLLLSKGVNVNAKNERGETPIGLAAALYQTSEQWPLDFFEVLEVFKEHGADFNCVTNRGNSPLTDCIAHKSSKVLLQKLVDLGADPEFVIEYLDNMTLLQLAVCNHDMDAADLLLSSGADINKKDKDGKNALYFVFDNGLHRENSYEMIKFLLERGISVNSTDKYGQTFLHTLCANDVDFDTKNIFGLLKTRGGLQRFEHPTKFAA